MAISEIRCCFIILSLVSIIFGLNTIRLESKKHAELFYQSAIFFGCLLVN